MMREGPLGEVVQHMLLNFVSSFYVRFAHNAMYYMVNFFNWENHFMHYFFPAFFLLLGYLCSCIPRFSRQTAPLKDIVIIVLPQIAASITTAVIHTRDHYEAVYMYRWADCIFTLAFIFLARRFLDASYSPPDQRKMAVIAIGILSSIAWFEYWITEYDRLCLFVLTPLLGLFNALHYLMVIQKSQKLKMDSDTMTFWICFVTALLFFPFAYFKTQHTFTVQMLGVAQTWVLIDSILFMLTIIFMSSMTYSKYWMMQNTAPETYIVYRHLKYLLASVGIWFLEPEKAEILVPNVLAKILAFGAMIYYAWKRFVDYKYRQRVAGQI